MKTDMVPVRQGWLVRAMTERGFHTRDRVVVLALVLVGVVNIAVDVGGVVADQHVRNWIGWEDAAEKQVHEYTSLSKSSYEGLSRRWKQVLADVFMGSDTHLPAAVELLGWLETEELDAVAKNGRAMSGLGWRQRSEHSVRRNGRAPRRRGAP